jgi:pimeloyl-ACP methyl ester carboxylesterase
MSAGVGVFGRLNAQALLTITPEYAKFKRLRSSRPEHGPTGSPLRPEFVTVNGTKVRIAQGGNPDGPCIVLLSPLPQSIYAYGAIWPTLAEQFRLIALDLPGFGGSDGGVEFMNFEAQGTFLAAFLEHLETGPCHVVGPDVGMSAALHCAIHENTDIVSLIIGDGPGIAPSSNGSVIDKMVDSAFWRRVFVTTGAEAFVGAALQLCYLNYVPSDAEIADYVASYEHRMPAILAWFKGYPESLATVDPYLAELDLPVQVFWGDMDELLYVDNGRRLNDRLPRSRLRVFEHCGHFSYQDQHASFAAMVTDWVESGYQEV